MRFRLKQSFDVSSYDEYERVILNGLKKYGFMIYDSTNDNDNIVVKSVEYSDTRWEDIGLDGSNFVGVHASDFEAVDVTSLKLTEDSGKVTGMAPVANFTKNATSGTLPLSVQFNDTSTNTPTQWNWSFGDANWTNGTTQNVTHTYPSVGTYNIFLIASNAAGSNQSANQTVTVYPPAVADFTATADGATVTFTDTTTGSPTAWSWAYNNHATPGWVQFSTAQNPAYTFPTGTYDINLTATNPGMADSEIKSSYVVIGSGWEPAVPGGVKPVVGNVDTQIIIGMMIILILPLVLVAGFIILILNGKGRSVDPRLLIAAVFAIVLVVVVFWIVFAVNGNG
jgi:PKD repeat protein